MATKLGLSGAQVTLREPVPGPEGCEVEWVGTYDEIGMADGSVVHDFRGDGRTRWTINWVGCTQEEFDDIDGEAIRQQDLEFSPPNDDSDYTVFVKEYTSKCWTYIDSGSPVNRYDVTLVLEEQSS